MFSSSCCFGWSISKFQLVVTMSKVNNSNNKAMSQICSKLPIEIPNLLKKGLSGVFVVKFEQVLHNAFASSLMTSHESVRRKRSMPPPFSYPVGIYLLKVNNKDTRTTSMTSFWCLYC